VIFAASFLLVFHPIFDDYSFHPITKDPFPFPQIIHPAGSLSLKTPFLQLNLPVEN
jgi:hypothetical protein